MKLLSAIAVTVALAGATAAAQAEEQQGGNMFTGDVKLACEALLCLSSGQRPDQCAPSLQRYFSINEKKLKDTLRARGNFLKLCPTSSANEQTAALVESIMNGAGYCDAASLNATLMQWNNSYYDERDVRYRISNVLPSNCSAYGNNSLTDQTTGVVARYVGTPETGGRWVDPQDYEQAQVDYDNRQTGQ